MQLKGEARVKASTYQVAKNLFKTEGGLKGFYKGYRLTHYL